MVNSRYAVVTGGTRGIGLEVARGLITQGIHVIVIGSNPRNGRAAVDSLAFCATSGAKVWFLDADLAIVRLIPALAIRISMLVPHLDILVHNAGVITSKREVTDDGFEMQFAVNHLAVYALTHALMPLLRRAPTARIVVTASHVEKDGRLDFDDLMRERDYQPVDAYCQSKLANVLFTFELARRIKGTNITANCLHPGAVRTELLGAFLAGQRVLHPSRAFLVDLAIQTRGYIGEVLRNVGILSRPKDWALTPREGASTTVWAATAPEIADISGSYFKECSAASSSPQSREEHAQRMLWNASAAITGIAEDWP